MCNHILTYRNHRSECLKCDATFNDDRGVPRHWWAINGVVIKATLLQSGYACPICLNNIRVRTRMTDGRVRPLCDGDPVHDIGELRRAITKDQRDRRIQEQEEQFDTIYSGLPEHLRKEIDNANKGTD